MVYGRYNELDNYGKNRQSSLGGFHGHGGIPFSMDDLFQGKSIYKWMRTGDTPILGNLHMGTLEHKIPKTCGPGQWWVIEV